MRKNLTSNPCVPDLYALYASKNQLCTLCEDTTPELTAYNAYRNANRRVRRAEGTKMYALKDAYKAHTKCIQSAYKHIKRVKREDSSSYFFLHCLSFYLYCPRFQAFTDPIALIARSFRSDCRYARRSVIGGRSFERYMRIVRPHGEQNFYGRHHHRPPHSARGLRKHRGGGLH